MARSLYFKEEGRIFRCSRPRSGLGRGRKNDNARKPYDGSRLPGVMLLTPRGGGGVRRVAGDASTPLKGARRTGSRPGEE